MDHAQAGKPQGKVRAAAPMAVQEPLFWPQTHPDSTPTAGGNELFSFRFGTSVEPACGEFSVPLRMLMGTEAVERWFTHGDVTGGTSGNIRWRKGDQVVAAHLQCAFSENPIESTREAYRRLLRWVRRAGYPYLVRVWNVLPDINLGDGDSERYRQFCVGRAAALTEMDVVAGQLPAATAVGGESGIPLTITLVAARRDVQHFENPRQVSAYQYPRQYGPRSPSFARATGMATADGQQLLISGTASIVGHRTVHDAELSGQVDETKNNLGALVSSVHGTQSNPPLNGYARVYLRNASDLEAVAARLAEFSDAPAIVLHSDICRRDLLFEIEGSHTL